MIARGHRVGSLPLLLLLTAPVVSAQEHRWGVPEFVTVRVISPDYTGEGTLVRLERNALELGVEGVPRSLRIPFDAITLLEYRRPASGRERAVRGGLWGAGTLGLMGFLIADRPEGTSEVEAAVSTLVAGGLWGGLIGFLIPQSRWEPVDLAARANGTSSEIRSEGHPEAESAFLWATYGIGATNGMAWILGGSLQRARQVFSLRVADTYEAGIVDAGLLYGRVLRTEPLHLSASTGIAPVFGSRVSTTVGIPLEVQAFRRRRAVGFGVYGFGNLNPEASFVGVAVSIQGGRLPHE